LVLYGKEGHQTSKTRQKRTEVAKGHGLLLTEK
jgi:hypothetical protein